MYATSCTPDIVLVIPIIELLLEVLLYTINN